MDKSDHCRCRGARNILQIQIQIQRCSGTSNGSSSRRSGVVVVVGGDVASVVEVAELQLLLCLLS